MEFFLEAVRGKIAQIEEKLGAAFIQDILPLHKRQQPYCILVCTDRVFDAVQLQNLQHRIIRCLGMIPHKIIKQIHVLSGIFILVRKHRKQGCLAYGNAGKLHIALTLLQAVKQAFCLENVCIGIAESIGPQTDICQVDVQQFDIGCLTVLFRNRKCLQKGFHGTGSITKAHRYQPDHIQRTDELRPCPGMRQMAQSFAQIMIGLHCMAVAVQHEAAGIDADSLQVMIMGSFAGFNDDIRSCTDLVILLMAYIQTDLCQRLNFL